MSNGRHSVEQALKLKHQSISIGTWNVRTLYQTGKTELLKHEMKRYSWDILGISELRWTSLGINQD